MSERGKDEDLGLAVTTPSNARATAVERPVRSDPADVTEADVRATPLPDAPRVRTAGRFVVDRVLGEGGMGVVMLAHDPTLDREVAIKLLRDDRGTGSAGRVRLLREAQAMARLRHPNVATVYEAGVHEGQVFLVMEHIAGGTLRARLAATREPAKVLELFVGAGRGLAAAHRAGVVHRDFKPENVLVDAGIAKVTDFGLAAQDDAIERAPQARSSAPELDALSHTLTRTGDVMGTPRYMAPEQHAAGDTDARTDQFSFCVALYEALYGRHPFRDDSRDSLKASVLDEPPRPPPERPGVSPRIRDAIVRGLARDPAARFPAMDDLLAVLMPPPRRNRRALAVAAGALLLVLAGALAIAWPREAADPTAASRAAARACDCELVELQLPPGATVTGIRRVTAGGLAAPQPAAWQPTRQLAIPRGAHVVDYRVAGQPYAYAVVSRGDAASRTIALPAPAPADGFVFVPGGEVEIGDAGEQPVAVVELGPYLIGRAEHAAAVTYDDALRAARDHHARLATAAEWEWAARLGIARDMLDGGWEWTASELVAYPYVADARDDPFAPRDRSEVRGGEPARAAARRAGFQRGRAELRLARTPPPVPAPEAITIELEAVPHDDDPHKLRDALPPRERTRLDRFLLAWIQLADRPPLLVEGGTCQVMDALRKAGVPTNRVDDRGPEGASRITVRWHPDRGFTRAPTDERQVVVCDRETQLLDAICFDGERLHPVGEPTLRAVAATLTGNPKIRRVEIQVYVGPGPDPIARSQRRAELVRARMIAVGVAANRLVARGLGAASAATTPATDALFEDPGPPPRAGGCPPQAPGERVVFHIAERDP